MCEVNNDLKTTLGNALLASLSLTEIDIEAVKLPTAMKHCPETIAC